MTDITSNQTTDTSRSVDVEALLGEIVARLDNIALVLELEHNWLDPRVALSREIDDETIRYQLSKGHLDEEEAAKKRGEDNLLLDRSQVDKHLHNIHGAADFIRDISTTIGNVFIVSEPVSGAK